MNHRMVPGDDRRNRVERLSRADLLEGFVQPRHGGKARRGVPVVGSRITGVQSYGAPILFLSSAPVPILRGFYMRQRGMSFGEILSQHYRRGRARGGLGPDLR